MLTYLFFILTVAAIYGLLAHSLSLSWGTTGMVNIGLVGFFAIGAYTSAILTRDFGLPVVAGFAAAAAVGWLAGLLVCMSTLRLKDEFLAIVTLGFAEVVRTVAANEIWLTGGTDGISGIPSLFARGEGLMFHIKYFAVATALCLASALLLGFLNGSPWGRVLRAVREDQVVAAVAGKAVARYKASSFSMSTAIAGLAGGVYGSYISFIGPDLFMPLITIYVFLAVASGGNARALGATLGAYVLVSWLEISRFITEIIPSLSAVQAASLREIGIGVALALVLRLAPEGVFREVNQKAPRAAAQPAGEPRTASST